MADKGLEILPEKGIKWKPPVVDIKKLQKEVDEYNAGLEARARKKEDLIVPIEFEIIIARFYGSSNRTFTPSSEMVMGGRSPSYDIGDSYSCEFDVDALTTLRKLSFMGYPSSKEAQVYLDSIQKIRKLSFIGWPALESGNKIRAHIFAGQEKGKKYVGAGIFGPKIEEFDMNELSSDRNFHKVQNPFVLVDREFNENERALKIEKISDLGNIVATWIESDEHVNRTNSGLYHIN